MVEIIVKNIINAINATPKSATVKSEIPLEIFSIGSKNFLSAISSVRPAVNFKAKFSVITKINGDITVKIIKSSAPTPNAFLINRLDAITKLNPPEI